MKKSKNRKIKIIAEIAQAHDGSLGMAHSFIDAVAKTGADGIKFQTHIAESETTVNEPWRVTFSKQDKSRFDYWKRMEFEKDQWLGLKKHTNHNNLLFLSSPFSIEAFDLLNDIGVHAWKVASGEITNYPMIEKMAKTKLPIWLSTGMSNYEEISNVVDYIKTFKSKYAIFQCTSSYPTTPDQVGLNILIDFKSKYNCDIGLSDHSGTIFPSLAAATLGANILEIHVTFSKDMFGPDVSSSITISELKTLVEGVRYIESMISNPLDKEDIFQDMYEMRNIFMKRIVTKAPIKKNEKFSEKNTTVKKSNIGLSAIHWGKIINSKTDKDLPAEHWVSIEDIKK